MSLGSDGVKGRSGLWSQNRTGPREEACHGQERLASSKGPGIWKARRPTPVREERLQEATYKTVRTLPDAAAFPRKSWPRSLGLQLPFRDREGDRGIKETRRERRGEGGGKENLVKG